MKIYVIKYRHEGHGEILEYFIAADTIYRAIKKFIGTDENIIEDNIVGIERKPWEII